MSLLSRLSRRRGPAADRRLLERAAGGSERALGRLYDDHVDALYGFVFYRVGRDSALAEDVVQETFTLALDRFDDYSAARGSFASWLCTLSRNVIRSHLREHRRADELAACWERIDESLAQVFANLDREPLTDEVLARAETRDLVNIAIAHLPERYRDLLIDKYVAGKSIDELAGALELSPAATKSLLARARRAFREAFSTLCHTMAEAS